MKSGTDIQERVSAAWGEQAEAHEVREEALSQALSELAWLREFFDRIQAHGRPRKGSLLTPGPRYRVTRV